MENGFREELDRLIRARYTLLYVVTWEEARAMRILMRLAEGQRKSLYEWSVTNGLRCVHGAGGQGSGSRTRIGHVSVKSVRPARVRKTK